MGRVIRARGERVVPLEVLDAKAEAAAIVERATERGAVLVRDAQAEAEAIRACAQREGEAAGRARAASLVIAADAHFETTVQETEGKLVQLAVGSAEGLIRAQLALDTDTIQSLVRGVLETGRRAQQVTVRVHPDDGETLRGDPLFSSTRIEDDSDLERGDCVIITDLGLLDGRLAVRVDALRKALLDR